MKTKKALMFGLLFLVAIFSSLFVHVEDSASAYCAPWEKHIWINLSLSNEYGPGRLFDVRISNADIWLSSQYVGCEQRGGECGIRTYTGKPVGLTRL